MRCVATVGLGGSRGSGNGPRAVREGRCVAREWDPQFARGWGWLSAASLARRVRGHGRICMRAWPRMQAQRARQAVYCRAVGIGWSGAAVVAIGGPAIVCCDSYDVAAITRPRCSPGRRPWALLVCLQ